MNYIVTTEKTTGEEVRISYKDYGKGKPVVLIHGWPSSKEMWEYQIDALVQGGCRVIKYDRRGFGKSDKPWDSYDYDTLADDLNTVLEELELEDVMLVGFSMGGGEVARYMSRHNGNRVSKVVLVSSVLPYMLKTEDNPDGVDGKVFEDMMTQMKDDRMGFLDGFGKDFFGVSMLNKPMSTPLLDNFHRLTAVASPRATQECAKSFSQTDFRKDIPAINVPTLIIHGDSDKTVPIKASSDRTAQLVTNNQYVVYDGAPHGLFYTHKEQLNQDLLAFINE